VARAVATLGSVGFEPEPDAKGERFVWLEEGWVNKLSALGTISSRQCEGDDDKGRCRLPCQDRRGRGLGLIRWKRERSEQSRVVPAV
jgi:hypothetical protein